MIAQQILGAGANLGAQPSLSSPPTLEQVSDYPEFNATDQALVLSDTQFSPSSRDAATGIGTPIRLAPSSSAFRQGTLDAKGNSSSQVLATQQGTPSKGVLGQVSDLIFGW